MTQVWCGIPVYNNSVTIADIARRCRQQIDSVVVIDDGSTDADLRDLLKSQDVTVVRHPANQGKGAALLTAFQFVADRGGEYLITLDGDGQHYPEDIPAFISRLAPDKILIGTRDHIEGLMPGSSQFGREFSDLWISVETGAYVRDTQSGFRAYPIRRMLQLQLVSRHYNLEMEIVTRSIWSGLQVEPVPIRVRYPDASQRVSSFHPFLDNFRISLLHTRLILRQMVPIPHSRLPDLPESKKRTFAQWLKDIRAENSSPLGLALAAGLTIVPAIVLWPFGWILALYAAQRLHLNKLMVLANLAICLPRAMPELCLKIGRAVVQSEINPHLAWIVGAHIVAFCLAAASASLVYIVARRMQATAGNQI